MNLIFFFNLMYGNIILKNSISKIYQIFYLGKFISIVLLNYIFI
jgi:hypothetical protein